MKNAPYCLLILLLVSCANFKERKMLGKHSGYQKHLRVEGKFDRDSLTDYFYILTPDKQLQKETSRCILVFGNKDNRKNLVFDDLLPITTMSGKIDHPFEMVRLKNDALHVRFLSSAYGHNELEKQSYTFSFNAEKQFFSLIEFETEICMLPECEVKASIHIDSNELVNAGLPFSYSDWLVSGRYFSNANCLVEKNDVQKWDEFASDLKKIGLADASELILQLIRETQH